MKWTNWLQQLGSRLDNGSFATSTAVYYLVLANPPSFSWLLAYYKPGSGCVQLGFNKLKKKERIYVLFSELFQQFLDDDLIRLYSAYNETGYFIGRGLGCT